MIAVSIQMAPEFAIGPATMLFEVGPQAGRPLDRAAPVNATMSPPTAAF
jgi:hypothetical protein